MAKESSSLSENVSAFCQCIKHWPLTLNKSERCIICVKKKISRPLHFTRVAVDYFTRLCDADASDVISNLQVPRRCFASSAGLENGANPCDKQRRSAFQLADENLGEKRRHDVIATLQHRLMTCQTDRRAATTAILNLACDDGLRRPSEEPVVVADGMLLRNVRTSKQCFRLLFMHGFTLRINNSMYNLSAYIR